MKTEVAFVLLNQQPRVQFSALLFYFDAAEIYQRHDLECEELKYADQTHQVLGLYCKK